MTDTTQRTDYSSRLFGGGLYGKHHTARFLWLQRQLAELGLARASILELGCFDARSVDFVPFAIERYVGIDAGWESGLSNGVPLGLEAAQRRFAGDVRFSFVRSTDPADINDLAESFDVGICLETFEHIDPARLDSYLSALTARLRGPLFVTVPNEKGIALLAKTIGAKMLRIDRHMSFTKQEFVNALVGRMERVARNEHKGFDYAALADAMRKHFGSVKLERVGLNWLPLPWQLTVGLVAMP